MVLLGPKRPATEKDMGDVSKAPRNGAMAKDVPCHVVRFRSVLLFGGPRSCGRDAAGQPYTIPLLITFKEPAN